MYQWSVCTRFGMVLFHTNEYHGPTCVGGGRKKWQKLKLIVYCFSRDNKRIQKRISVSCVRTIGRNACLTPASHASHKSLDLCLGNVGPFLPDMTPEVSYGVAKHSAIWDCAADLIPTVLYGVEIRATGWPWIHPSNVFHSPESHARCWHDGDIHLKQNRSPWAGVSYNQQSRGSLCAWIWMSPLPGPLEWRPCPFPSLQFPIMAELIPLLTCTLPLLRVLCRCNLLMYIHVECLLAFISSQPHPHQASS